MSDPIGAATTCPLCSLPGPHPVLNASGRRVLDCRRCRLVWVHPLERPTPDEELARYDEHENDPADPAYRTFLSQVAEPLTRRLSTGDQGLDFGCGPGPALVRMLTEAGYPTSGWDPFYAPEDALLERRYDFVTATEVAEHFHDPARSFALLNSLLRPGGWVGIMTALLTDDIALESWWYVRDPTHVSFYRPATLDWLAGALGWRMEERTARTVLFQKTGAGPEAADEPVG